MCAKSWSRFGTLYFVPKSHAGLFCVGLTYIMAREGVKCILLPYTIYMCISCAAHQITLELNGHHIHLV